MYFLALHLVAMYSYPSHVIILRILLSMYFSAPRIFFYFLLFVVLLVHYLPDRPTTRRGEKRLS